ncbi:MAG: branched-chain amino acid ABC transporter permease [Actinobacteria bacterium]|nr:branched-chain amino acid ABC transporter permease [Actinomycetota bacterium]MCG2819185.1 branched-chain amino acid ABC transporter permease [Actinomycetes bacterium]MBU4219054.1 branched-chain amino acid ABC transporter permease [Actinomycetota bacterium]MBU4359242.1 branched-chain amino acid ABC transporter permease [Actinomycetota bacterium]MBU4391557.1 branched-chain amino acid ABC transporter permease [Actinomycetota bacterium]
MEKLEKIDATEKGRNYRILLILSVFIFTVPFWAGLIPGSILHMDIVNLMVLAGTYACAVIGLNLLVGYAGQISLGHAAFFGIGAYTTAILCTRMAWFPTWLGVILGGLVAGIIGWLVGVPVLRLKGHYLAMATLGLGEIAFILFTQLKGLTGGTLGILNIPSLSIFGLEFDTEFKLYFLIWAVVMLMMLLSINIICSRVGRALRALHSSDDAAEAMGINTARYKTMIFVLSAVFAGIGGALFAHFLNYIDPASFTFFLSILFITMVVIGGMGNIWGGLVGVIFLIFLPEVIQGLPHWIPLVPESLTNFGNYELVVYGLLLILFMMYMPKGIAFGLSRGTSYAKTKFGHLRDRISARKYEGH